VRQVSKKEQARKRKLSEVYKKIDNERDHKCSGCGQRDFLSHSHLITQKNKTYQCDEQNIVFDCLQRIVLDGFGNEGCHQRWESGKIEKLRTLINWRERVDYIKDKDSVMYNKVMVQLLTGY
jgi:hypothetical protein